ncbi:hypothetical protein EIN_035840 [Entamoeba invadens IP1]|uniref:Furin repeat-containing protein n=1 Tax=Entamoeba invadens IP1 TaxID=370355 RepID=A0A0A1U3W8_ENTIV|nr:hypothetical protein EIN_035840 [Entamoeba invadens IP1]ELP86317.1 hypothetical protein EIN_035840 [Entamoeba invadens IP1]|eukprot:XP_004185663.1 hypothetical protein EIN_035840 [Entamoeba invadens IP1]
MLLLILLVNTLAEPLLKVDGMEPIAKIPHCKSFTRTITGGVPTDTLTCTACENEMYKLSGGQCVYDSSKCPVSNDYVYLKDNICQFCDYSCNSCSEDGVCTCKFGLDNSTKCRECVNTFTSGSTTKCSLCTNGMSTDTSLDACSQITDGPEVHDGSNCALAGLKDGQQICLRCYGNYSFGTESGKTEHCATANPLVEGCLRQNQDKCSKCDIGYLLVDGECQKTDVNCDSYTYTNEVLTCKTCREGYNLEKSKCTICSVSGDEHVEYDSLCELFPVDTCSQCSRRCKVEGAKCVPTHCSEFDSENRCVICDEGYYQLGYSCHQITNDGFSDSNTKKCVPGYYTDYDTTKKEYTCKKCPPHFVDCLTDKTPLPGSSIFKNTKQTKSEPCDDENCEQCSDDGKTCYKCLAMSGNSEVEKISGECVIKATLMALEVPTSGAPSEIKNYPGRYPFCRYKGFNSYFEDVHPAYKFTQDEEDVSKIRCDLIHRRSHMYVEKVVDTTSGENSYECTTAGRDPLRFCQCMSGYYQENSSTAFPCKKANVNLNCLETANGQQCTVCPKGAKLTSTGACKCTDGTYLKGTECVSCPEKCLKCNPSTTDGEIQPVCTECKPAELSGIGRDPSNKCECKKDMVEDETVISVCLAKPNGCKNSKDSYVVSGTNIRCVKCDDEHKLLDACEVCVEGYYNTTENGECLKCAYGENCLSCNSTMCTACTDSNAELKKSESSNNYCETCKPDYAYNSKTKSCMRCPSTPLNSVALLVKTTSKHPNVNAQAEYTQTRQLDCVLIVIMLLMVSLSVPKIVYMEKTSTSIVKLVKNQQETH